MEDKKNLGLRHEVDYNLELVSLVGANTQDKSLSIEIDEKNINGCLGFSAQGHDNLIAIHPWTSDPVKQWPVENFYALAKGLLEYVAVNVVIVGDEDALNKIKEIFGNLSSNLIDLTGKTTLVQLAALLKKCELLISGDSGPVHLACAVGTPVVAIFRNDLPGKAPKRWGPWGNGHTVIENPILSGITVEEVLNKVKEIVRIR
jgi:ADP-heptose:LPS heptosyltransferase